MQQDSLQDIWERIRDRLRALRGQNLWRGGETHILPKLQVRLEGELRGDGKQRKEVLIHLSDAEVEIWAELLPGNEKLRLKELNLDLDGFVDELVKFCRGGAYLHTNSKTADYRKDLV